MNTFSILQGENDLVVKPVNFVQIVEETQMRFLTYMQATRIRVKVFTNFTLINVYSYPK
jgi:hypothetical protein